jgi:hypothetical protein
MTRQKDLKRRVRARMQKTGESYTAARARLAGRRPPAAPPLPGDYLERVRMSDAAVQAGSGKTWPEWVAALDALGAAQLPHREIAQRVHDLGVRGWWAQNVSVGYERIRGLRDPGQRRGGSYTAHKSRTFPVAVERLFEAFSEPALRERWLPAPGLKVSKATPAKYVHMRWTDGAHVEVVLVHKGAGKAQAAIQHEDLADAAAVEERKLFWSERLNALSELLGAPAPSGAAGRERA